jgi:hypothetical protein
MEEDSPGCIFQQDGAPPHFHNKVRSELNDRLPNRWIGCASPDDDDDDDDDDELLRWPPRSPDLTRCGFVPFRQR